VSARAKRPFPAKLYVRVDVDGGETVFYAYDDPRDLADRVEEKTIIAVYRLDHVAALTVTATLEPQ
jgi:hypothetical protein